jgi:hypothetical protein
MVQKATRTIEVCGRKILLTYCFVTLPKPMNVLKLKNQQRLKQGKKREV